MSEHRRSGIELLLAGRPGAAPQSSTAPAEPELEHHAQFYGFLRGVQDYSHNIEFRPAHGAWLLIEYSYFVNAKWRDAGEFTMYFGSGHRVTVRGRHLRDVYDKLRRHRVTYIRAAADDERLPEQELFIDEISIEYPKEEGSR